MTVTPIASAAYVSPFDQLKKIDEYGEWWSARDLLSLYGYSTWQKFSKTIDNAKIACATSARDLGAVTSNFNPTVKINSSRHKVADVRLTRHAAYLVAMEGDPAKPEIAGAKTYFAVQAHKAELDDGLAPRYQAMMETVRELARLDAQAQAQQQMIDNHSAEIASSRADIETHREEFRRVIEEVKGVAKQIEDRVVDVETVTPLTDPRALHSGKEAAHLCGMGHIVFFDRLRDLRVIYRDQQQGGHKMHQDYMNRGWGSARITKFKRGDRDDWTYTPYFTAKGITGIQRLLAEGQLPL